MWAALRRRTFRSPSSPSELLYYLYYPLAPPLSSPPLSDEDLGVGARRRGAEPDPARV